MRQLHRKYSESNAAEILIVYQKEPHAGQLAFKEVAQPKNFEERCLLAQKMKDEYELPMQVLIDTMEDQSRALFSDLPSPAFVIDEDGIVRDKFPWADAALIETSVANLDNIKKKKSRMSPASYVAIFLPLFVVFLVLMTQTQSRAGKAGESGASNQDPSPE